MLTSRRTERLRLVRDLAARVSAPAGRILIVTDFDGTIAEIDLDPMAATIDPGARRGLRRLARLAAERPDRLALAVLSGRAMADVAGRVRIGGVHYLGNHGLERAWLARHGRLAGLRSDEPPDDSGSASARLGRAVAEALGRPDWLFVEVKGGSVAFHYRQAPVAATAFRQLDAAVSEALRTERLELERFDGRLIVELRPVGAGGKGAALRRLLAELRPASVLALGDDRSDAEVFEVLRAERSSRRLAALNVGVHDRQATPAAVLEAADVMLARPREAGQLLLALAASLGREAARPTG
ncbi:MAG TPA: trehalose-phosphatase [Candidatus Limnocylindrales bacterium]